MENVVLYRKYRPQYFSEIIGQLHVTQTLQNALRANTISHAYLFSGPRGSGKTTIARIFAKAINCEQRKDAEPCGTCDSCEEILAGRSLDLIEIDAASHTGVDDVRELISGLQFSPVKSKYKIFIIDECHQLSKSAANALLKTLEEPPPHVIFILATTEAHKMIATITSRCQRFDFKKLHVSEITQKLEFILKKEKVTFEKGITSLIALNARGSFRDAESLLDTCIHFTGEDKKITVQEIKELLGVVEVRQVSEFVQLLLTSEAKEAIIFLNTLLEQGVDLQEFAKTLIFYLRQSLLVKLGSGLVTSESSGFSEEELVMMREQVAKVGERDIQKMLELFIQAENNMKYATIIQLPLELAVVEVVYREA